MNNRREHKQEETVISDPSTLIAALKEAYKTEITEAKENASLIKSINRKYMLAVHPDKRERFIEQCSTLLNPTPDKTISIPNTLNIATIEAEISLFYSEIQSGLSKTNNSTENSITPAAAEIIRAIERNICNSLPATYEYAMESRARALMANNNNDAEAIFTAIKNLLANSFQLPVIEAINTITEEESLITACAFANSKRDTFNHMLNYAGAEMVLTAIRTRLNLTSSDEFRKEFADADAQNAISGIHSKLTTILTAHQRNLPNFSLLKQFLDTVFIEKASLVAAYTFATTNIYNDPNHQTALLTAIKTRLDNTSIEKFKKIFVGIFDLDEILSQGIFWARALEFFKSPPQNLYTAFNQAVLDFSRQHLDATGKNELLTNEYLRLMAEIKKPHDGHFVSQENLQFLLIKLYSQYITCIDIRKQLDEANNFMSLLIVRDELHTKLSGEQLDLAFSWEQTLQKEYADRVVRNIAEFTRYIGEVFDQVNGPDALSVRHSELRLQYTALFNSHSLYGEQFEILYQQRQKTLQELEEKNKLEQFINEIQRIFNEINQCDDLTKRYLELSHTHTVLLQQNEAYADKFRGLYETRRDELNSNPGPAMPPKPQQAGLAEIKSDGQQLQPPPSSAAEVKLPANDNAVDPKQAMQDLKLLRTKYSPLLTMLKTDNYVLMKQKRVPNASNHVLTHYIAIRHNSRTLFCPVTENTTTNAWCIYVDECFFLTVENTKLKLVDILPVKTATFNDEASCIAHFKAAFPLIKTAVDINQLKASPYFDKVLYAQYQTHPEKFKATDHVLIRNKSEIDDVSIHYVAVKYKASILFCPITENTRTHEWHLDPAECFYVGVDDKLTKTYAPLPSVRPETSDEASCIAALKIACGMPTNKDTEVKQHVQQSVSGTRPAASASQQGMFSSNPHAAGGGRAPEVKLDTYRSDFLALIRSNEENLLRLFAVDVDDSQTAPHFIMPEKNAQEAHPQRLSIDLVAVRHLDTIYYCPVTFDDVNKWKINLDECFVATEDKITPHPLKLGEKIIITTITNGDPGRTHCIHALIAALKKSITIKPANQNNNGPLGGVSQSQPEAAAPAGPAAEPVSHRDYALSGSNVSDAGYSGGDASFFNNQPVWRSNSKVDKENAPPPEATTVTGLQV